jgi:hypothetical protein
MTRTIPRSVDLDADHLAPQLSHLPEELIRDWFWSMCRQVPAERRLNVLLVLTRVTVRRAADWDSHAVRAAHGEHFGLSPALWIDRDQCFGCGTGRTPLYSHHVIEIQNGGSNAARNQVTLCFDCHQYLHPWLEEELYRPRGEGLEQLGDVMARIQGEKKARS